MQKDPTSVADGRARAAPGQGSTAGGTDERLHRPLRLWLSLAVSTLALAGIFAFLLALSRIPGIEGVLTWPIGFFDKGLVIHVVFSFVVWFLAILALLSLVATHTLARSGKGYPFVGTVAGGIATLAIPLLFVPAFLDRGEATLNNYVPVIIDPLYYAGLVLVAIAIAVVVLQLLAGLAWNKLLRMPVVLAVAVAGGLYLLALVCFVIAAVSLFGEEVSHSFNEDLFWGGGHVLQFTNTAMMIAAWGLLAAQLSNAFSRVPGAIGIAALVLLVGALPAPLFYVLLEPFSAAQTRAFTALQYVLGPSAIIAAFALVRRLPRPLPWGDVAGAALMLSMVVFAAGGVLGLFVDGADTRTPAHYHGVIAGVTLAFMGIVYTVFLPHIGRSPTGTRLPRIQLHLFAWGQLAASIGLFVAGGYGAPRKVAGDAQGLDIFWAQAGMAMNGFGGLFAVIGGILFVWITGSALIRRRPAKRLAPAVASR